MAQLGHALGGLRADARVRGSARAKQKCDREEAMSRRRRNIALALVITYLALLALIAIGILGLAAPN